MKNYLIFLAVCFYVSVSTAQINYPETASKFLFYYNAESPDSIFAMFSPELKEKMPLEKARAVISGLHIQFGELRSLNLLKTDSGFNIYKAAFSHQTLCLLLALTDNNQMEGFRLVPYDPDLYPEEKARKK